ncbi:MAG TPA: O-antigen ligase family protein, partial [Planctomycetota bacterium]|nr:O-antigen ligase family protein [Planctomycetota bacterium]
ERSAEGRIHFWQVAVTMANECPILGVGFNAYTQAYDTYDSSKGDFGTGRAVHSVWFGVLAETGYIGLALYVILFVCALRNCHVARKAGLRDPTLRNLTPIAASFETSLFVFLVGGLFLSFQYNEMILHFLATTMVIRRLVPAPAAHTPLELAEARAIPAQPLASLTVTR